MGRFRLHLQRFVVGSIAVIGVAGSAMAAGPLRQGQTMLGAPLSADSAQRASPSAPGDPRSTAAPPRLEAALKRYKLLLFSNPNITEEKWLVFDVIADSTFILLKHATTDGLHWWDHPLTAAQICRISPADGGEKLVDCVRAISPGGGEPLRIVMPAGACRQDCLLTFSWVESGRNQEWMIRLDSNQTPAVIARRQPAQPGSDHQQWRYRIKLSPGSASLNLRPESWVLVDVAYASPEADTVNQAAGTIVTLRHSTNAVNLITGFSRWWDHPILSSRACPLFPGTDRQGSDGCVLGISPAPGYPLGIPLPAGASIHDYRFSFSWRENNRIQNAAFVIDRLQRPEACPPCR